MTAAATTWLFDLGNTRLKYAPLLGNGRRGKTLTFTHTADTAHAADAAHNLQTQLQATVGTMDLAVLASVAPPVLHTQLLLALSPLAARIELARTQACHAGLRIAYTQPQQLGVDRWLALLATYCTAPARACVLVGVGTALTIDLLADGRHIGGMIAPSTALMREALHQRAPHLPRAGGQVCDWASNTADALATGATLAAVALIRQCLHSAQQRYGPTVQLHLHGGGASALQPYLPDAHYSENRVLDGLQYWLAG